MLVLIILVVLWLVSSATEPAPRTSQHYSFIDYLLESAFGPSHVTGAYPRKWGYLLYPLLFLLLGGDVLRTIREMPLIGWIILFVVEATIYLLLYWRYTVHKNKEK